MQVFGDDWKKAEQFVSDNEVWIRPVLEKSRIDYYEAVAVIFPELVRYSALRDKMEITLLKALYINLGQEYANFSIGHLQMKPSFAQTMIEEGRALRGRRKPEIKDSSRYSNIRDYRADIIKSLEDIKSQVNYLIIFFRLVSKKFDTDKMNRAEKIQFLATTYNYGIDHTEKEILEMASRKFFSTKLIGRERYSYSEISLYWYTNAVKSIEGK